MRGATGRWLMIAAGVAVIAAIAAAIATMGSPAQQRLVRQDERRERDLTRLKREIEGWAERNEALPASLSALARPGVRLRAADPFTSKPYEYQRVGEDRYRLCAVFDADTAQADGRQWEDDWRHSRGRQCFDLKLSEPAKAAR